MKELYILEEWKEDLCSWNLAKGDGDGAEEEEETSPCRALGPGLRIWVFM